MRGGMQLHDAYNSTYEERKSIGKMVDENLKITKESKMPFF
jgi:hypothetical protein|tara:strand:- start:201 stop:323 length:123 start_codon:yes stop_codon:yes gene_type:complete